MTTIQIHVCAVQEFHACFLIIVYRLLGKARISLEELVEGKNKKKEFNVDLNDGNNRPTEVTIKTL